MSLLFYSEAELEGIVNRMGCRGHCHSEPGGIKPVTPESGAKEGHGWIPKFRLLETEDQLRKRYGKFGPNPLIYLGLLHRLAVIMVACSLLVTIPLVIINYYGNGCHERSECRREDALYKISILNLLNSETQLKVQAGIWLAVSVCLSLVFIPLRAYAVSSFHEIDNMNTTISDFSLILRRIPTDATKEDIEKMFNEDILHRLATKNNMNSVEAKKLLQIREIYILERMNKTLAKFEKEVERFEKSCRKKEEENFQLKDIPPSSGHSGTALVIFNSTEAVNEIKTILHRSFLEIVIEYFFPFISPRTDFKIKNKKVSIFQAPEPSAILWQNIGRTTFKRIITKLIFTIYVILMLVCSALITYYVAYFQEQNKKTSNSEQGYLVSSFLASIVIFIFNFLIEELLKMATRKQKIDTEGNFLVESLYVIVIHQSINLSLSAIVIPIIMFSPLYFQGFVDLDVPNSLIILMCSKIFFGITLEFLYDYFEVKIKVFEFLVKKGFIYRTQYRVNQVVKGIKLNFESKYASIVQMFLFGLIFSVISPLCLVISALGLCLLCLYERILFNSKYKIPRYTGLRIQHEFINLLRFCSLCIGIANLIVHRSFSLLQEQSFDSVAFSLNIANIAVGGASCLIPWEKVFGWFNLGVKNKDNICYEMQKFELTYHQANPLNSWKLVEYFSKNQVTIRNEIHNNEKMSGRDTLSTPEDINTERPFKISNVSTKNQ